MTKQEDFCKSAKEKSKIKLKLVEINPYIRFAAKIKLYSSENITTSYDCRFLYITKGSCILTINNREYALKSDDAALWNSGQKYSFAASDDCECYIINFDYTQDAADKDNSFLPVEANNGQTGGCFSGIGPGWRIQCAFLASRRGIVEE